jgi:hypothetical protein
VLCSGLAGCTRLIVGSLQKSLHSKKVKDGPFLRGRGAEVRIAQ